MKLILTRHGRTEENDAGILQGHLPGKLGEKGILQAQKVALRLRDEVFDFVYSSDLARAADTTKEILKYHPSVPVEFTQELREMYLGEWQGRTKKELGLSQNPELEKKWPKGGETPDSIFLRAKYFLEKILLKHHDDCVLLVGHDSINRNLVSVLSGQWLPERMRNTSISIFELDELGKAEVELFDCVEHLD